MYNLPPYSQEHMGYFLSRDRSISSWRNEKCNNAVLRGIFLAVSETFSNMWHFQNNTVPHLQIEVSVTQCQELSTFTCLFRYRCVVYQCFFVESNLNVLLEICKESNQRFPLLSAFCSKTGFSLLCGKKQSSRAEFSLMIVSKIKHSTSNNIALTTTSVWSNKSFPQIHKAYWLKANFSFGNLLQLNA